MSRGVWQATIVDELGNVLPSSSISVRDQGGALVALYDAAVGGSALPNPFTADAEGFARFYVEPDLLDITATSGGSVRVWEAVNIGDAALRQELAASLNTGQGAALVNGAVIYAGSVAELVGFPVSSLAQGHHMQTNVYNINLKAGGGGDFYWAPNVQKVNHNGGAVISPTVPFSENVDDYMDATGETDPSGFGVFIRSDIKMLSLEDFGVVGSVYGRYPSIDSEIHSSPNSDILHNGNVSLAKTQYGIRRNATILSARGGRRETPFEPAVTGVSDSIGLANYGAVDSVSVFADNITVPYESWEEVSDPSFTFDGFTSTTLDFSNLKLGMILETAHTIPWYAFITDWDASSSKVFVDGWVRRNEAVTSTPTNDSGVRINPISKIWAHNANIIMEDGAKTNNGVVCEYGVQNKDSLAGSVNGIDTIVLDGSLYDCGAAYIARGHTNNWAYGFLADGSLIGGFYSFNAARSFVSTGSPKGFVFAPGASPGNAIEILNDTSLTSEVVYNINSTGRIERSADTIGPLAEGITMSKYTRRWLYGGSSSISVNLPTGVRSGDVYKIMNHGIGAITLNHSDPIVNATIQGTKSVEAVYSAGTWIVL